MSPHEVGPEEQYRRLRDPERWVGVGAPAMPASRTTRADREPAGRWLFAARAATAVALLAGTTAVLLATGALHGSPTGSGASRGATSSPTPTPGTVIRSVRLQGDTWPSRSAAAAGDTALYVAALASDTLHPWRYVLSRIDAATGSVRTRTLVLRRLSGMAVGPDGLYVWTDRSVSGHEADEILRLDPDTLQTRASRTLDAGAAHSAEFVFDASGTTLVESDAGGAVRLLDPETLATIAVRTTDRAVLEGNAGADSVAVDGDRIWIIAEGHLLALAARSLRTEVSVSAQGCTRVVPTGGGLRVLGARTGSLAEDGTITPDPEQGDVDASHPVRAAYAVDGGVLEQTGEQLPEVRLQVGSAPGVRLFGLDPDGGFLVDARGRYAWLRGADGAITQVSVG